MPQQLEGVAAARDRFATGRMPSAAPLDRRSRRTPLIMPPRQAAAEAPRPAVGSARYRREVFARPEGTQHHLLRFHAMSNNRRRFRYDGCRWQCGGFPHCCFAGIRPVEIKSNDESDYFSTRFHRLPSQTKRRRANTAIYAAQPPQMAAIFLMGQLRLDAASLASIYLRACRLFQSRIYYDDCHVI